jgi:hypothetical protein
MTTELHDVVSIKDKLPSARIEATSDHSLEPIASLEGGNLPSAGKGEVQGWAQLEG